MLILNLKTYQESTFIEAEEIASTVETVLRDFPEKADQVFLAPALTDTSLLTKHFPNLNFISQHVDPQQAGSTTGRVPAQLLLKSQIHYCILNHSEYRVWNPDINSIISNLQATGLKLVVCCENLTEAQQLLEVKPFAITFEPPELIGTGKSVSTHEAQTALDFLHLVEGTTIQGFIGAGITTAQDIKVGNDLGAKGYILSSAFVKAADRAQLLKEFISVL